MLRIGKIGKFCSKTKLKGGSTPPITPSDYLKTDGGSYFLTNSNQKVKLKQNG